MLSKDYTAINENICIYTCVCVYACVYVSVSVHLQERFYQTRHLVVCNRRLIDHLNFSSQDLG